MPAPVLSKQLHTKPCRTISPPGAARRIVLELLCTSPCESHLCQRHNRSLSSLLPRGPSSFIYNIIEGREGGLPDLLQYTMCTCETTIPLYPKLPCICYRGIIKFHCIFAWFWRFMPRILYMIQGNNWGKITNLKFEPHENQKFPHVQSDWTKWDKYMLNGITNDKF